MLVIGKISSVTHLNIEGVPTCLAICFGNYYVSNTLGKHRLRYGEVMYISQIS